MPELSTSARAFLLLANSWFVLKTAERQSVGTKTATTSMVSEAHSAGLATITALKPFTPNRPVSPCPGTAFSAKVADAYRVPTTHNADRSRLRPSRHASPGRHRRANQDRPDRGHGRAEHRAEHHAEHHHHQDDCHGHAAPAPAPR